MKYTLYFLMSCLCLSIGCGKEKTIEVSKLESSEENVGGEANETPKAEPEEKPVKSGSKAGTGRRPEGGFSRGNRGRNSFAELGLTEAQQAELDAARQEMVNLFTPLFADRDMSREERTAKMQEIREAYNAKIKGILTDEQFAKYEEAQNSREQGSGRRPGQGERSNPFASLGLQEAQQTRLDTARQEMSTQMRALFTDRDTPREERTAKMQKIREDYEATVKDALTEEQFQKYQEAQSQRGQRRPGGGFGGRRPGGGSSSGRRPGGGFSGGKSKENKKD
jgi:hypothetical protein